MEVFKCAWHSEERDISYLREIKNKFIELLTQTNKETNQTPTVSIVMVTFLALQIYIIFRVKAALRKTIDLKCLPNFTVCFQIAHSNLATRALNFDGLK